MNPLWLSLATLLSTAAGGLCALRLRARLHLLLGFTAGVLLGVVAFDLWPESLEQSRRLSGDGQIAMVALVAGFVLFHALKRVVFARHAHGDDGAAHGTARASARCRRSRWWATARWTASASAWPFRCRRRWASRWPLR